MRPIILTLGVVSIAACLLIGCGQSPSTSNENAKNTAAPVPPSSPVSTAATSPAPTSATSPTPTPPISSAPSSTTPSPAADAATISAQTGGDAVSQFASNAAAQPDKVAASIGSDLVAKANSLTQAAQTNPDLKTQVGSAMQSLSAGKDASALTTLFQQAKQSNLTSQQTQLVKEVGNLASAYVVQRNFSSLDGAQGDVATVVNSMRKGSMTPALPALKSLAQNASLTSQQKDLLGTLAEQYAPGFKKASDSLKQGFQSIPGLGK